MWQKAEKILQAMHDTLFKSVHSRNLIYNTCWEDPRIDRELLAIDKFSKVVVITSAGCNVLDYLLDLPAQIHAVDVNSSQNALLELKIAFYKAGNYEDFWKFFGLGYHESFTQVFQSIKNYLLPYYRSYWEKNITYFSPYGFKKTFYYRGTSGTVAWLLKNWFITRNREIRHKIYELFEVNSLAEQKQIYDQIEEKFWGSLLSWFVKQPILMIMLGVPRPQIELILKGPYKCLLKYIKDKMRWVFTKVPIKDNYFWYVYIHGAYSEKCHPNYLSYSRFNFYKENIYRISVHHDTISDFLKKHPDKYSHFILLDHQDWMAYCNPAALEEEWELILKNSRPGSKILFRSAGPNVDFIPQKILGRLSFDRENCERLHKLDRVGTYGSLHLAKVL